MSYVDPVIPLISAPVGLDYAIQTIQVKMGTLDWISHAYGKSTIGTRKQDLVEEYYPEVYHGSAEYKSVEFNDFIKGQCFFIAGDAKMLSQDQGTYGWYTYPLSVVFWFNYDKIDTVRTYRFIELLKQDAVDVLIRGIGGTGIRFEIDNISEQFKTVFREYSYTESDKQYIKHPYGCFRIDGEVTFTESCYQGNIYTP